MDPATICGTISAAISFVEFTGKIIKTARDISESKQGATRDNLALEEAVRGCQERLNLLKNNFAADTVTSGDARCDLEEHIRNCQTLNDQILKLLADTTAKSYGPSISSYSWIKAKVSQAKGKIPYQWKTSHKPLAHATAGSPTDPSLRSVINATLHTIWKKEKIEELRREWERCVDGLNRALHRFENIQGITQLNQLGKDTSHQLESLQVMVTELLGVEMPRLRSFLVAYHEAHSSDACVKRNRNCILKALAYDSMTRRWQHVKDPITDTFKWIPESDDYSLKAWLAAGDGIYHVSGKPGSGKSTFMKLLETGLRKPGSEFIFASFYAWKPDSDSHEWQAKDELFIELLLRSLLHMILEQAPDLMPIVFKQYWHPEKFTLFKSQSDLKLTFDDLSEAFEIIQEKKANEIASRRFFFLIDGLDEFYDPDQHFKLTDTIKGWCSSNIKICVSSREDTVYMKTFPESNRLHLHEVTKRDIHKLVKWRLEQHPFFLSDRLSQTQREGLTREIVAAAKGVFVWVIFTTNELYGLLNDEQEYEELINTVTHSKTHGSLEAFLKEIISRIPDRDREKADLLFSIVATLHRLPRNRNYYGLAHYWMATKYLQQTGTNASSHKSVQKMSLSEVESRVQRFRSRLPTITRGLLEPALEYRKTFLEWNYELQYTHRSVYEYLQSESSAGSVSGEKGKTLDGTRLILESVRLAAKTITWEPGTQHLVKYLHKDAIQVLLYLGSDQNAETIAPFVQELEELLLRQRGRLVPVAAANGDTTEAFVVKGFGLPGEDVIQEILQGPSQMDHGLWYVKWAASDRSHSWTRSTAFKQYVANDISELSSDVVETGLISLNEDIGIKVGKVFGTGHKDPPIVTFPSIWTYEVGAHLVDYAIDYSRLDSIEQIMKRYTYLFSMGAEPRVCFQWRLSLTCSGSDHEQLDLRPTTFEHRDVRSKPARSTLHHSVDTRERENMHPQSVQHWKSCQEKSREMSLDVKRDLGVDFELGLVVGPEGKPSVIQIQDRLYSPFFACALCQTYETASGTVDLGAVIMSLCANEADHVSRLEIPEDERQSKLSALENQRENFLMEYHEALLRVRSEESPNELNNVYGDSVQREQVEDKTPPIREFNSSKLHTIGLVLPRNAHGERRIWRSALCVGAAAVLLALVLHRIWDVFSWD